MRFLLRCLACGTTVWGQGEDDPDTNGCEVTDAPFEPSKNCPHDDYEITAAEYPDEPDWP